MTATIPSADRMLRLLLDDSPVGMLIVNAVRDADGQLIDFRYAAVNDKIVSITGFDNSLQLEGRLMGEVFPHTLAEGGYFHRFKQVIDSGQPISFETSYQNRLGQSGWYQNTITPHDDTLTIIVVDITATKQTEQRLQAQTQLLEGVLNSSPAAIFAYEPICNELGEVYDFRITLANQAAADLSPRQLVTTPDAQWLIGKTLLEVSPNSQALSYMLEASRTGQSRRTVLDYPEFERTFEFSIVNYGDGLVTTTADITALYQQKKLLQTVLDVSPTGIVLYEAIRDPETNAITDFRYRLTNPTIQKVAGKSHEELMKSTLLGLFPASKDTEFWDTLVNVADTGQPRRLSASYLNEGTDGWYEGDFVRQDDGVLFTFVDITRTKQVEFERQQQADRMERILDRIPAVVFVTEAIYDETNPERIVDFLIRHVNVLGAQDYNLSREQMVGRRASDLFPEDRHNGIFDRYVNVVQTQQPQQFDLEFGVGDARHWVDIRLVPFDASSVVATSLDITPIKQAQYRLETINHNLQRSNDNLQKFAYVASHDLQEPLRKVQSFGDILMNQYTDQLSAEGLDLIRRMQSSAARMSVLVKDLLAFSRIATQQDDHKPHALNELIAEVLDDLDLAVREAGAQVDVAPLPVVRGDGPQLRQLFQNLLGNALKFRQPGVSPVVSITHRRVGIGDLPKGRPINTIRSTMAFWEICVADNGIGFDEKYIDRIFQIFQRLHNRNQFPGTGIGLAICQKVVENHAGVITASSKPGEGTTFRVFLPV